MLENKKILLMSSVIQEHSSDGYSNSAFNMSQVLSKMVQDGVIKSLEQIDLNKLYEYPVPLNYYDCIIIVINPFMLINPNTQAILDPYFKRGKKVYLQIVWETDPLPKNWNCLWTTDVISGFIAPSHFVEKLIKKETSKPVYYIPHFIDIKLFKHINLEEKFKENIFTVLCAGQWTKRKGHEDAIKAYVRALGHLSDCRLIVKYSRMNKDDIHVEGEVQKVVKQNTPKLNSPIFCQGDSLSKEELVDLYNQTSVLLYPSRGEGFGLITAEVTSIGIPIIYTDWSATSETAKAPGNIPTAYILDECVDMAHFGYEIGSNYAIPVIKDLMKALQMKYMKWKSNREDYYKETLNNYKVIEEKYGMDAVKNQFINFFEKQETEQ